MHCHNLRRGSRLVEFEEENKCNVTKGTFTGVFGKAFSLAFTPETIKAAFRVNGIHAYDLSVITPQQMKPSEPTSTKCGFPLLQPSPVWAIMSAYRCHPPTSFDIDPDTHCGPGASSSDLQPINSHDVDVNSSMIANISHLSVEQLAPGVGPNLGMQLRAPLRPTGVAGGLVFRRDLTTSCRETAIGCSESPNTWHHNTTGTVLNETEFIESLERRMVPAIVVRCVQHLFLWGVHEEGLFRYVSMRCYSDDVM